MMRYVERLSLDVAHHHGERALILDLKVIDIADKLGMAVLTKDTSVALKELQRFLIVKPVHAQLLDHHSQSIRLPPAPPNPPSPRDSTIPMTLNGASHSIFPAVE